MSRSKSRARQRRQRLEAALREAVRTARTADTKASQSRHVTHEHGALWQLLRTIERSKQCVWDVVRVIRCTEDERAMIAQAVAPHLAGMTPGNIVRRRKLAK